MTDDLAKLSWTDVRDRLAEGCAAIVPVGATEAHGPHLPLDTDVTIALGMARRAAARLSARGHHCVVLPPLAYAVTEYARSFPGTLSLRAETAAALLADVLGAAVRTGFRPVAVANGHLEPAHVATVRAAVERVRSETGAVVVFPDVTRRALAERLSEAFRRGDHAGRYESSLVLADDPAAVKDALRATLPPVDSSLVQAIRDGKSTFAEAGGEQAYFGRPAEATAAEGRATFEQLAELLFEALLAAAPGR